MTFKRESITDLMTGLGAYAYVEQGDKAEPARILATRRGVLVKGELTLSSAPELQAFAKAVADAYKDYKKMKPNLMQTLAGH